MSFLLKLETVLRTGLKWLMIVVFSSSAIMYFIQLISRLFFKSTFQGIDWWVQYGFVVSALMGASYAVKENENIKIELFHRFAKKKWVKKLNAIISVIITLIVLGVFYQYTVKMMGGGVKNLLISLPYMYLFFVSFVSYLIKATNLAEKTVVQ